MRWIERKNVKQKKKHSSRWMTQKKKDKAIEYTKKRKDNSEQSKKDEDAIEERETI